jgi:hypothetical protein
MSKPVPRSPYKTERFPPTNVPLDSPKRFNASEGNIYESNSCPNNIFRKTATGAASGSLSVIPLAITAWIDCIPLWIAAACKIVMSLNPTSHLGCRTNASKFNLSTIRIKPYPPRLQKTARMEGSSNACCKSSKRCSSVPENRPNDSLANGLTTGFSCQEINISTAPSMYVGSTAPEGDTMATLSPGFK